MKYKLFNPCSNGILKYKENGVDYIQYEAS